MVRVLGLFRGHAQHRCGPSRCGRARHQGGGRALGHGAFVCDPYFIHKHIDGSSPNNLCMCNIPFEHCDEGTWSFQGLARLDVWHVWASGWTPGRPWTLCEHGTGTLGVWQCLAHVWKTSGTSGQRLAHVWPASGSRLARAQLQSLCGLMAFSARITLTLRTQ
jgi:hypothetical protein